MDLRTPLGKVKGLGAAGSSATAHWWMQRVSAVALIPLVIWFVLMVICAATGEKTIIESLSSPINAVILMIFIGTALYHGSLGMKVVYEDYVSCHFTRNIMVVLTNFFAIITAVAAILSIVNVHVNTKQPASNDIVEEKIVKEKNTSEGFSLDINKDEAESEISNEGETESQDLKYSVGGIVIEEKFEATAGEANIEAEDTIN